MAVSYTNDGSMFVAQNFAENFGTVNIQLCLFQDSFNPSPSSSYADFHAAEANFSGYSPIDGLTVLGPYLSPLGGANVTLPTQLFLMGTATPEVTNNIAGWFLWILATTGPGAKPDRVMAYGTFDEVIPMAVVGQAVVVNLTLNFGTGA